MIDWGISLCVCVCVCLSMWVSVCVCICEWVSVCICLRKWVSVFVMVSHVDRVKMFVWGIFRAASKGISSGQELTAELIRAPEWGSWYPVFDQSFCFKCISLFLCSNRSIFQLVPVHSYTVVPSFSLLQQRFYVQKWGNVEPSYPSNESRFWKIENVLLV